MAKKIHRIGLEYNKDKVWKKRKDHDKEKGRSKERASMHGNYEKGDSYFYEFSIEEPIREIVKELRANGINTTCSCGHGMWIQCETSDYEDERKRIFTVMHKLGIEDYTIRVYMDHTAGFWSQHLEIVFPDKNGKYYYRISDNPDCEFNKTKEEVKK